MLRLYYNPKCSKSRAALARLEAAGLQPEVIDYLRMPPTRTMLEAVVRKLDGAPTQLLREAPQADATTAAAVIDALLQSPQLLQRPIIEDDTRALIARPPERLDAFLADMDHPA